MPGNSTSSASTAIPLKTQSKILQFAEHEQVDLAVALEHFGHSFDDLVYEISAAKKWRGATPKALCDFKIQEHNIPLVSFFTGCGGIDLGFEAAGFAHIAAFEFNELFCKTLRKNRPGWKVFGPPTSAGDVSKTSDIIESLGKLIPVNFEGVFVGGPPCQPFSIAANQRFAKSGDNFKRVGFDHETKGNLLFDYVSIIKYFRPASFLIENVPGLRDLDDGVQLSEAIRDLAALGYSVEKPTVLNAADYHVPQYRERLFIIGNRKRKTVVFPVAEKKQYGAGSVLHRDQGDAPNNETRVHKLSSIRRYAKLNYGQRDQLGRVDRLDPCLPAKTVIAGGTNGGGRSHLHPEIPRTLSVRECARLQTFPEDYTFVGPTARQFTQVGNAVPPVLAAQIGISLAKSVFGIKK
ncbi:MAG: DNA (cytosine-5-)-methyltransferase [Kiritimatiellales bacterium]|jgi:DNA (cytosine-5)-methyltransferase 1